MAELAAVCEQAGVPLHTDAVAAVGKMPVHFGRLGVAAMSVAAHKFQGPLGIGALVLRHDVPLRPILFGGHQEGGLRPGTPSVALAVGMQTALELALREQEEHTRRMTALRDRFEAGLRAGYPGVVIHGAAAPRLPNTTNAAFPGLEGQILLLALDLAGRRLLGRAPPAPAAPASYRRRCGPWACPTIWWPARSASAWAPTTTQGRGR